MRIIKWDEETRKKIPSVFGLIYKVFGEDFGIAYAIEENDKINILAKSKDLAIYIDNSGSKVDVSSYKIDKEGKVLQYSQGDCQYFYYGNGILSYDAVRDMEESLALISVNDSEDSLSGVVQYKQYHRLTDTQCEIQYIHRYFCAKGDERARIYTSNLDKMSTLMIDENSQALPFKKGFLGKEHQYYTLMDIDSDYRDYYLVALKEGGLFDYMANGAQNILGSEKIRRYVKGYYVGSDGNFRTVWPLGGCKKEEDIKQVIAEYGFSTEIPSSLIEAYNGDNRLTNKVQTLLLEANEIEKNQEDERILLFKIRP